MASLLLSTKLAIPPVRPEHITRARLLARLQWGLRQAGIPAAWVSLDAADNDQVRFWRYLIAALEQLQPAGEQALVLLEQPLPAPLEHVLTVLINNLAAAPAEKALVLDDYHLIEASAIHAALAFVVQHLPPHVHLVLTSRVDPPLPIERLRARGQLVELRADELRFTEIETAAFLNDAMQLQLAPDVVERLGARTEGWAVGLQLAALALRNTSDRPGFVAAFTGSHRFVMDYLVAYVLAQQPAHLQTFLLQASILDRICGPLCDVEQP